MTKDDIILNLLFLPSKLYKLLFPPVWLLSSRRDEADGNALALYQWSQNNNIKEKFIFVLDNSSKFFSKDMIAWGSMKHKFYSLVCEAVLFDADNCNDLYHSFKTKKKIKEYKIFLQHGVIVSYISGYIKEKTNFDLVICTARTEKEYLIDKYNYSKKMVALAGLARHDDLIMRFSDKRYLFIAPTWRKYLADLTTEEFTNTEYYKKWISILHLISTFAKKVNFRVIFKIHYMFRQYEPLFSVFEDIEYSVSESIHELIRDCSIIITDYSSIASDGALINKPVIYYQFDYEEYRANHQGEGYFNYSNDGFGPIGKNENELIQLLEESWKDGSFSISELYKHRADSFFEFHDANNCIRNYHAIKDCIKHSEPRKF